MRSRLIQMAAFGAAFALVLTGMIAAPRLAAAKPEFSAQVKKPCGVCHQKPSGGPLTPTGK